MRAVSNQTVVAVVDNIHSVCFDVARTNLGAEIEHVV